MAKWFTRAALAFVRFQIMRLMTDEHVGIDPQARVKRATCFRVENYLYTFLYFGSGVYLIGKYMYSLKRIWSGPSSQYLLS
jgi:hypothetical protein